MKPGLLSFVPPGPIFVSSCVISATGSVVAAPTLTPVPLQRNHWTIGGTSASNGQSLRVAPTVDLPGDPPLPGPEVLTQEEAVRYLRLDFIDVKDPGETLRYCRAKGLSAALRSARPSA